MSVPVRPAQMKLNFFLMPLGQHEAGWRVSGNAARDILDVEYYVRLARTAERGKFDSLFIADTLTTGHNFRHFIKSVLDPVTLLSAIASRTSHIGLVATATTTYNEPFHIARKIATLDHLSRGRAGWNIVTSSEASEATNFGLAEHPSHDRRYERAGEFVDVVLRLWESWAPDAFVGDKQSGVIIDTDKVAAIDHSGASFRVSGPLTVPPTPQGRPVLFQAGSSGDGRKFAARYADAIFTAHQSLADARQFYDSAKALVRQAGRDPDRVKVLPGIVPVVGATDAEARDLSGRLEQAISVDYSLGQLSEILETDLHGVDLDGPLPEPPEGQRILTGQSRADLIRKLAARESLTVRGIINRLAPGRGHLVVTGGPETIADTLQEWFEAGAADGFNVMPPVLPETLDLFVDLVVPVLQRRGLFRTDYAGARLRDHLEIEPLPESA